MARLTPINLGDVWCYTMVFHPHQPIIFVTTGNTINEYHIGRGLAAKMQTPSTGSISKLIGAPPPSCAHHSVT